MCLYVCMCFLSERVKEKTTTNFALSAKFCDNLVRAILPCIRKVIFVVLVLVFFSTINTEESSVTTSFD